MSEPIQLVRDNYTIQIKYSPEAIEKKLMKFITPLGEAFEISADEMISILVGQVNVDSLSPVFVNSEKIDVVEVSRQLECVLEEDMKKGQKIHLNYVHPYPIEFALIEEAYKVAKVNHNVHVFEITKEYIDMVREKIKPEMEHYLNQFYKSFKNIHMDEEKKVEETPVEVPESNPEETAPVETPVKEESEDPTL
jgi:hypothetical protein